MSLVEGLAQLAAERGHGVYRPDTPYQPGEVAISLAGVLPAPEQLLAITPYEAGGEPSTRLPFDEPRVQFRRRGTPDEQVSRRAAQALYDDLEGVGPLRLPNGVLVLSVIFLQAGPVPLGRDDAGRHEHVLNARIEYHNPTRERPAL